MWEMDGFPGDLRWVVLGEPEWKDNRTNQLIRYAEVLLIYAEAQAMADNGPNALAYDCINRIRNRAFAGLGSTGKELPPGLSATAFRDSVFVERGWEFAGFEHASRWFDLQRFELVEDACKASPNTRFLPGRNEKEHRIRYDNLSKKDYYFLLIPEEDALLNPNVLDQNKQYN
jgi:hypothetical protein